MRRREAFAISAVTLLEIAALFRSGKTRDEVSALDLLKDLETNPSLDIIPISFDIAAEVAALGRGWLADPADRAIVATARVHGLQLVTADQRIIDSKLVPTVE
jgi:PIN domain nuclease of toxin-antitoxin system